MSAHLRLDPAERAAAVAAIDAEITRLRAERETLATEVEACRNCNESCERDELDGAGECRRCAAGELSDPDAEHREAFYRDVAGGCS